MASDIEKENVEEVQSLAAKDDDQRLRNAAAYGDMEKMKRLVEEDGCSVSEPDGEGYYAIQWAAYNNRIAAARYIIQHGGDVNATDPNGQTALHWSAIRGMAEVAEVLLHAGAQVNAADKDGYQPTHVAAQYGETAFLYHIVSKWNADADSADNYGNSPLHWAAYKGFADCIRLLLFLDAYRGRQDKYGYTPLHWAASKGNLEACKVLVQASKREDLKVTDNTGRTPFQLISDKEVAFFFGQAIARFFFVKISRLGFAPLLWCKIIVLLVIYIHSVILATDLPKLTAAASLFSWFGVFLATSGLVLLYRCSSKDPGYIRMNVHNSVNMKDDEPLLKIEINNPTLQAGNWSQLCTTCKIVRPLHSKHCSICDRCVDQFHRHCEWVSNCIGKNNKWEFLVFLVLETLALFVTGGVAITRLLSSPLPTTSFGTWILSAGSHHPGVLSFIMVDLFFLFGISSYAVGHAKKGRVQGR